MVDALRRDPVRWYAAHDLGTPPDPEARPEVVSSLDVPSA
jgi:hypothetical protein